MDDRKQIHLLLSTAFCAVCTDCSLAHWEHDITALSRVKIPQQAEDITDSWGRICIHQLSGQHWSTTPNGGFTNTVLQDATEFITHCHQKSVVKNRIHSGTKWGTVSTLLLIMLIVCWSCWSHINNGKQHTITFGNTKQMDLVVTGMIKRGWILIRKILHRWSSGMGIQRAMYICYFHCLLVHLTHFSSYIALQTIKTLQDSGL